MTKRWVDMSSEEKRKQKSYLYFNRERINNRLRMKAESRQIEDDADYSLMFMDICRRYVTAEKLA